MGENKPIYSRRIYLRRSNKLVYPYAVPVSEFYEQKSNLPADKIKDFRPRLREISRKYLF